MKKHLILGATLAFLPFAANAAAIITDGNVSLGVDDLGQLNIPGGVPDVVGETFVGTRWIDPGTGVQYESTSHGCLCEGWGVLADGVSGFANNASGSGGLTAAGFASTATTATVDVTLDTTMVKITHDFALSASANLMKVSVTIDNSLGGDIAELKYRRVMDWDTSPTPFSEYVTIGGTATTTELEYSSDDGFERSDMLFNDMTDIAGCGLTTDFTACGPDDHGALFDFNFGALAAGEMEEFDIFYGGAANLREARAALAAVGAELFSFGWSCADTNQDGIADIDCGGAVVGDVTPTFIFAFAGVGGTPVEPIPVPASALLLLTAVGGIAGLRRRRKAA